MTMHDFHTKLQSPDGDPLFAALAELRNVPDVSSTVRGLAWPDWAQPEGKPGA